MRVIPRRLSGVLALSAGVALIPASPAAAQGLCLPLLCTAAPAPSTPEPAPAPAPAPAPTDPSPGVVPATSASQVTSHLIDPQRTSHADDPGLVAPLSGLWSRKAGGTVGDVVAGDGLVFARVRSSLKAFDAATGRSRWTVDGLAPSSGLAYDAGRVVTAGEDGLVARSAADGRELWRAPGGQFESPQFPIATAGRVYAAGVAGNTGVTALDATTGRKLWSAYGDGSVSAPVVAGDRVFTSYACDVTFSWNRATGAEQWKATTGCHGGGSAIATAVGGRLYAPDDGNVWDQATGGRVGSLVQNDDHPVFVGGLAVLPHRAEYRNIDGLRAVDPVTGRTAWKRRVPGDGVTSREGPAPIGVGSAIYLIQDGTLLAYDARSGRLLQRAATGFGTGRLVPLGGGRLLVVSGSRLLAVRSALQPGPRQVVGYVATPEVEIGRSTRVEGRLGSSLAGGRPRATIEGDVAPFRGRWRRLGTARAGADGRFTASVRSDRNVRIRVRVGSRRAAAGTVVVYPRVSGVRTSAAGTTRFRVRYAVRGPRSLSLGGRRVFVYHQQSARRLLRRLGTGTLRSRGRGRAAGSATFRRIARFAEDDRISVCIRGGVRLGYGGGSGDRDCGKVRIRYR